MLCSSSTYPLGISSSLLLCSEGQCHCFACVCANRGEEREGEKQVGSPDSAWFACPVKGRWCRAMAEVSTSAPVKLRLSFTTGCSRPSFQTSIHPLFHSLSLSLHSHTVRYWLWHHTGLFAITHHGDSRLPAVNFKLPSYVIYEYMSKHKLNMHVDLYFKGIYVHNKQKGLC